jgi:hypothetical protein
MFPLNPLSKSYVALKLRERPKFLLIYGSYFSSRLKSGVLKFIETVAEETDAIVMRPLFSLLQQALRIIHEEPLGFKNGQ